MNAIGFYTFIISTFLLSSIAIYARTKKPHLYFISKPLPLVWILFWSYCWLSSVPDWTNTLLPWVLTGLLLGLLGDVFLLKKETFILGFLGFAGGHISYIIAFSQTPFVLDLWFVLLLLLPGSLYAYLVSKKTNHKKMMPLVWIYSLIISSMFIFSVNTAISTTHGWVLALGCFLFFISDGFWSWSKFVKELPWPGIMILSTYYGGQALIAYGAFQIVWQNTH